MSRLTGSRPTFIVAEAGVNHNGSPDLAERLVDAAAESGADAIKFQTFRAGKLASSGAPKAEYQIRGTSPNESQRDMLRKLELGEEDHRRLIRRARERGLEFLSSPFDIASLDLLDRTFDLPRLKIPSGELTNAPLLLRAAETGKRLILSTGMSTLGEIETALGVIAFGIARPGEVPSGEGFQKCYRDEESYRFLGEKVTLLHCTTQYPCPPEDANLRAMRTLQVAFGLPVGFSDHTPGIAVSIAAVALGAVIIEKHLTLDRTMPGPDHKASVEPSEFGEMVSAIRSVEAALGSPRKNPTQSEIGNSVAARKSLTALRAIRKGERFSEENLGVMRPGTGVSPGRYWEWLGKRATKDYVPGEMILE